MTFLKFPREIRDLIYSFIAPGDETYVIPCAKRKQRLPRIILNSKPDLSILWTSKEIQYEFLETLCAISTFKFVFPRTEYDSPISMEPLREDHAHLLQRIEIHMDLKDSNSLALRMLNYGNTRRKTCLLTLDNENRLPYLFIPGAFFNTVGRLSGFDTVIVAQNFKWDAVDAIDDANFRWYLNLELGPGRIYHEGTAVRHEFHPRESLAKRPDCWPAPRVRREEHGSLSQGR